MQLQQQEMQWQWQYSAVISTNVALLAGLQEVYTTEYDSIGGNRKSHASSAYPAKRGWHY
jgi:hypothetical protein